MLDLPDQEYLYFTSLSLNALSFISCLSLLFTYSQCPDSRGAQFKMLVNLSLCDALIAITGFLTYIIDKDDSYSQINTALSLVGLWSSAFWSSAVSILLYKKISRAKGFNSGLFYSRCFTFWLSVCVILPLIVILIVFRLLGIKYSLSDGRFDTGASSSQNFIIFMCLEASPFISSILMSFTSYTKLIKVLKEFNLSLPFDISSAKLLKYPLAQSLVFIPSLICKIVYIFVPYSSVFLNTIRLLGYYLAGFINSVVYRTLNIKPDGDKSEGFSVKVHPTMAERLMEPIFDHEEDFTRDDGCEGETDESA